MKDCPPIVLAVLLFLSGGFTQADTVPPNLDFKAGLEHWKASRADNVEALPDSGWEGHPGLRLTAPSTTPKVICESERFPVSGQAYRLTFRARNVMKRSNAGVYLRFFSAEGKELNNQVTGHDNSDQDIAIIGALPEAGWTRYEITGIPPEGTTAGSVRIGSWAPVTIEFTDFHLTAFTPVVAPPWPSAYKLSPQDTARLTEADVIGPDGRVYPDWRQAGVPQGIPVVKTVVEAKEFTGLENHDISTALESAIARTAQAGGGAIELPSGTFYLDHPFILKASNVVIHGAGMDKTKVIFRDHIPYGKVRLFNWAGGNETGPGGSLEIQANPKELVALSVRCDGQKLAESTTKMHWGNTYWVRLAGDDLLKKLGPGAHQLEGRADYRNGDHFTETFTVNVVAGPVEAPAPTMSAAVVMAGPGPQGDKILLTADGKRGEKKLQVQNAAAFKVGDRIRMEAPATPRWNALVGNHCPWGTYRTAQFEIAGIEGDTLLLAQPLRIEFPVVDGSWVQKIGVIRGSGIEGLTLEQEVITRDPSGPKGVDSHWFPIEDLWTNGITFSYAWGCWAREVRVLDAGRNSVYLMRSKFCEVRDGEFDNSLFKGGGGTAYVGFETAFDCLMTNVTTRRLRHAPDLQWGASGNVIRASHFYGSDAQFHAGWTNENLLEGNTITAEAGDEENGGYGFGIFASGPSSPEHGPEGPRNVIYHNDVTSPSTGLVMLGGNEGWMVLDNRFHIEAGHAVLGKEMTFDHIIAGNVFVIERPLAPAVYFKTSDCTGIELIDNKFYGPVEKISGFKGGFGSFAKDEGNEVFPLSTAAPLPTPAVESIYLWEKDHPAKP